MGYYKHREEDCHYYAKDTEVEPIKISCPTDRKTKQKIRRILAKVRVLDYPIKTYFYSDSKLRLASDRAKRYCQDCGKLTGAHNARCKKCHVKYMHKCQRRRKK